MQIVPLRAVPSQMISVNLNNQVCRINVYERTTGLFVDLYVNDMLVTGGVQALNRNLIVRFSHFGFIGDLAIVDIEGVNDPSYVGLGSQFILVYLFPDEVPIIFSPKTIGFWSPPGFPLVPSAGATSLTIFQFAANISVSEHVVLSIKAPILGSAIINTDAFNPNSSYSTFSASGHLTVSPTYVDLINATIVGSANFAVNANHTPKGASTFTGVGKLNIFEQVDLLVASAFTGLAQYQVFATHNPNASATLSGNGTITDAIEPSELISAVAALSAVTQFTLAETVVLQATGSIPWSASIYAAAQGEWYDSIALTGDGLLAITATAIEQAITSLSCSGLISPKVTENLLAGNIAVSGSGLVMVTATHTPNGSAILAGTGLTATTANVNEAALISESGVGFIATNATHTPSGSSFILGNCSFITTANNRVAGGANFADVATINAVANDLVSGSTLLNITTTLMANAIHAPAGSAALSGSGLFATNATIIARLPTTFIVDSGLIKTMAGIIIHGLPLSLTATGKLTTIATRIVSGAVSITGKSGLTAAADVGQLFSDGGVLGVTSEAGYPVSPSGLGAGQVWSNGGVVSVVPTYAPGSNVVYFSPTGAAALLASSANGLPNSNPGIGSNRLWVNGNLVCIA